MPCNFSLPGIDNAARWHYLFYNLTEQTHNAALRSLRLTSDDSVQECGRKACLSQEGSHRDAVHHIH